LLQFEETFHTFPRIACFPAIAPDVAY